MFDVGFSEMLLIGVVALLAFGPDRLPKLARELAFWIRKVRGTLATVRSEIEQEMALHELDAANLDSGRTLGRRLSRPADVKAAISDPMKSVSAGSESRRSCNDHE